MDLHSTINPQASLLPVLQPTRFFRLAHWVSILLTPPLVAATATMILASLNNKPADWYWAGTVILFVVLLPISYLGYLYQSRKITDLDVYIRTQRVAPYLFSILCNILAVTILEIGKAPLILKLLTASTLIEISGLFFINLFWKISAHTAAVAGFSTLFCLIFGAVALPALILVPLVAWSRVKIKRHTLAQTIAGAFWGAVSFSTAYLLSQYF